MKTKLLSMRQVAQALVLAGLVSVASHAVAVDVYLCAKPVDLDVPGGTVPMWGFAPDNAAGDCSQPATVPGPPISVPVGDSTLNVYLKNALTAPVSIVINGQPLPAPTGAEPVWTDTTSGKRFVDPQNPTPAELAKRVRSLVHETAPGTIGVYNFSGVKAGTYLYHSGTHPQVQVQMGLYGAAKHDAASGQAYTGVPYASEVTLLFSEIDPALHAAVAAGQYGPSGAVTSTIDYAPQYFLINGQPYTDASLPLAAGSAGQTTLLRLLNAGLQTRSPVLQGMHMRLVAEDGRAYPYGREQYSVFLPALKTVDAVITPSAAATYPLYDRRLAMTNPGTAGSVKGGMLAFLTVAGAASGTPVAVADSYSTGEDTPLTVAAALGVLGNDTGTGLSAVLINTTAHGTLSLAADGGFSYNPAANFSGKDSFSYKASNGSLSSATATVSLSVTPANDPPVAANNAYSVASGATLNITAPGVLGNDSDVDGDPLTAVNASTLAGLSLSTNGSFVYNAPATAGSYSFTYQAQDPEAATSAAATVTFTVLANRPPVALADTFAAAVCRATKPATPCVPRATVALAVLANDSDPDGNLDPATVTIVTPPNKGGTVTANADGTVSYTPKLNFRGTENFSYRVSDSADALSNIATVKVNVK